MSITFTPIGIIHSPFQTLEDMSIQPTSQARGQVRTRRSDDRFK